MVTNCIFVVFIWQFAMYKVTQILKITMCEYINNKNTTPCRKCVFLMLQATNMSAMRLGQSDQKILNNVNKPFCLRSFSLCEVSREDK
tara:strand:+ start:2796 stop:3059 length:264 start_codon:yes stop_codon:yes gene_type:complete